MSNEVAGYIGLSRFTALHRELDVVTNNIANMNTASFKGESSIFHEYVENFSKDTSSTGDQSYVIDKGTYRDLSQGGLEPTDNPLDVALQGPGWYSYMGDEGIVYGRDGRLVIDDLGRLSTLDGKPILDINGGEIVLPLEDGNAVQVSGDGTLSVGGAAIAQLGIVDFDNPQRLERLGNGYYSAPDDEFPLPAFDASVAQGMVETSNVQPVVEMTKLISLHRAYENISKLTEMTGELQSKTIQKLAQR